MSHLPEVTSHRASKWYSANKSTEEVASETAFYESFLSVCLSLSLFSPYSFSTLCPFMLIKCRPEHVIPFFRRPSWSSHDYQPKPKLVDLQCRMVWSWEADESSLRTRPSVYYSAVFLPLVSLSQFPQL